MKIVALTDIHGAYEIAQKIIEKESPDVTVIGGDLTTIGSVREAEDAVQSLIPRAPVTICVAGNMDLPGHDEMFVRCGVSVNASGRIINSVGFFGVSGAPISPLRTPYEITEEEISKKIAQGFADVRSALKLVFIPHAPPRGTKLDVIHSGAHVGSTAVRTFIDEFQPDVVICGHIHEASGQDWIGRTQMVNCGPAMRGSYAVIIIGDEISIRNSRFSP